ASETASAADAAGTSDQHGIDPYPAVPQGVVPMRERDQGLVDAVNADASEEQKESWKHDHHRDPSDPLGARHSDDLATRPGAQDEGLAVVSHMSKVRPR